jgi:murein DD-endopeptidase MepM/ murein hydrolase activator NlpD
MGLQSAAVVLLIVLVAHGCASPRPMPRRAQTHVVARGETVWLIARRYNTTVGQLARLNRLRDPSQISVGQRLRVPRTGAAPYRPAEPAPDVRDYQGPWIWPVNGSISSLFGRRGRRHHEGLDIMAASGTPVYAAARGRVIYAGARVSGYGNMVILKHEGSIASVYAHNRRNLVRVGQWVEQGEMIAEVGQTGRASGPHLHFELRRDGRPQDPQAYLP